MSRSAESGGSALELVRTAGGADGGARPASGAVRPAALVPSAAAAAGAAWREVSRAPSASAAVFGEISRSSSPASRILTCATFASLPGTSERSRVSTAARKYEMASGMRERFSCAAPMLLSAVAFTPASSGRYLRLKVSTCAKSSSASSCCPAPYSRSASSHMALAMGCARASSALSSGGITLSGRARRASFPSTWSRARRRCSSQRAGGTPVALSTAIARS
mmetsp:Transcript_17765/g.45938  ORF Transcript_17765/g.45938 Transcript_17765/m.45938 type:complete len:222 (-) Transcript_17765:278-943(-)